jgi:GNAT superfamily N-acetyltransferase
VAAARQGGKIGLVLDIRSVPFDHPDAQKLIAALQQVYVERYGGLDDTRVDPGEFAPPRGAFHVGYVDGVPVASGGWRARDHEPTDAVLADGDAEIKRMYVADDQRGRGFARALLAAVERSAAAAGRRRLVLETGTLQPEAIALYLSSGYSAIPTFGAYRDDEQSRCYAKYLGDPGRLS